MSLLVQSMNSTSRLKSISVFRSQSLILKHQINILLNYFNQLDTNDSGLINKKSAHIFYNSIQCKQDFQSQLKDYLYSFDHLLSILGKVQVPQQPAIYVIMFIRTLMQFKNKFMRKQVQNQEQENDKLTQIRQIDVKIRKIINNQIQRQKNKIQAQNHKAYQQMQQNQNRQIQAFQHQWSLYLQDFQQSNYKRFEETSYKKRKQLNQDQSKFIRTSRRHSLLTSTKLKQLQDKKKKYVNESNYNQAMLINQKIKQQKLRISSQQEQKTHFVAKKRYQSLRKKNQSIMQTTFINMTVNINKLISKKKQGQNILQIRMKTIREETKKKLNEKLKQELNRLKSLFYEETRSHFLK